jgi:hypothetical protein
MNGHRVPRNFGFVSAPAVRKISCSGQRGRRTVQEGLNDDKKNIFMVFRSEFSQWRYRADTCRDYVRDFFADLYPVCRFLQPALVRRTLALSFCYDDTFGNKYWYFKKHDGTH